MTLQGIPASQRAGNRVRLTDGRTRPNNKVFLCCLLLIWDRPSLVSRTIKIKAVDERIERKVSDVADGPRDANLCTLISYQLFSQLVQFSLVR